MFINSALNEGLAGMQQSQRRMVQIAQDIVSAGVPTDNSQPNPNPPGTTPQTNAGAAATDLAARNTVEASPQSSKLSQRPKGQLDSLAESLVEQKRQQHVFDASAKIVKVASDTIGTLLDDIS